MNKYEKFTKISDLVIEMAELIKDDNIPDSSTFQSGMKEFIPKEYETVQRNLFPPQYIPYYTNPPMTPYSYGYGQQPQQYPWSSAWAPGSPVTQQRDIFDNLGATKLNDAMKKEEEDLDDATKFIEYSTGFLPKGHLDINMPLMGDIVEAVREKNYEKAARLVKDHWIEGVEENQVPPKNSYIPFGGSSVDPIIPSWPSSTEDSSDCIEEDNANIHDWNDANSINDDITD